MTDNYLIDLQHLLDRVLALSGMEYYGPRMCAPLADIISQRTGRQLSETTVKRLFGFAACKFRHSGYSLDTLALFCGFAGWHKWEQHLCRSRQIPCGERQFPDFKKLFYYSTQAMWVFDTITLRFLEVNDAACWTYGYRRQDFFDMTIMDIRPEEDRGMLLQAIQNGDEYCYHQEPFRHRLADGELVRVDVLSYSFQCGEMPARLVVPLRNSKPSCG
jgi:PAS domain S-box-containing protein